MGGARNLGALTKPSGTVPRYETVLFEFVRKLMEEILMRLLSRALVASTLISGAISTISHATEERIKSDALPRRTVEALNKRFPGLIYVNISKETDAKGQVVYDVELKQKGRKFETDIKNDGTMLEVEKEVRESEWPKALKSLVESKTSKSAIKEVMEVNKVSGGKEVPHHLEVTVQTAGGKSEELLTTLDGKQLTTESDAATTAPSPGSGGDEDIKPEDLPKALTSAIFKKYPGAKIASAEKGTEDGKPIYEATIKSEQHSIDLTLSPDGKILSIEKTLLPSEYPKATLPSLHAKYPHAIIKTLEEVCEDDKCTGYEAVVITANKKSIDVEFDTSGKLIEKHK